jgi:UDP-glucose 4-epimerase
LERAVIIGARGFVGKALAGELERRGVPTTALSSVDLDLRDAAQLEALDPVVGPGTVVYAASALTPDRGATLGPLSDNLTMVVNLARYLVQHPPRLCVFFSSDAVYAMGEAPVSEDSPHDLSTAYALAKYAGERLLQQAAADGGFPLLALRPTGVFGPGDTHNSYGPNRFVRSAKADRVIRLFGGGEERRDHVFIDDLARLSMELGAAGVAGMFNVATGTSRSFASIAAEVQRLSPEPVAIEELPRRSAITHREFDVSRLRQALPRFQFTPFDDALATTFAGLAPT